jgi:hypothetical protein
MPSGPTPDPNVTPDPAAPGGVFGVELESVFVGGADVAARGVAWTRRNALLWSAIEPTEGARNWSAVAALEAELIEASRLNLTVILVVRSTPAWARKYAGSGCGPIRSDKFIAFGRFLRDAVLRYKQPPFNVKYWELGNEPDAQVFQDDRVFGCWGETSERFFGGMHYAQMLRYAYPQIKGADSSAQVLIGGLMSLCNPDDPVEGYECGHATFFEGILAICGASCFDGVSFHTYDYYWGLTGRYNQDGWRSRSSTTGPLQISKARFYRSVMQRYGVTGKFLVNTEAAVICWSCSPSTGHEITKSYYVPQVFSSAMAEDIRAVLWYSYSGWEGSHLVTANGPSLALIAMQVASTKLAESTFSRALEPGDFGGVTGLMGYRFMRGPTEMWVVWSLDDPEQVTLPRTPSAITNPVGAPISPARQIQITVEPLYIEWTGSGQ